MGTKIFIQAISTVWNGKCMPSFSQNELMRFIVIRQDRVKAVSRVFEDA